MWERRVRRLHRAATVVVGIQLLIWTATGFAFTCFDFGKVRGAGDRVPAPPLDPTMIRVDLQQAIAIAGRPPSQIELRALGGRPTWAVGDVLVDALDGRRRGPLRADEALELAR